MVSRFANDTAVTPLGVTPLGAGRYGATIDRGWWIVRGPNGGYVAAIVLRAMQESVADASRHARSLTVHFTAPPVEGPAEVHTTVERQGRSVTTISARLVQAGRTCALAVGAFSDAWPGPEVHDRSRPQAPPPEECVPNQRVTPAEQINGESVPGFNPPALLERYDMLWAFGTPPGAPGNEALAGGWIRFADAQLVDACAAAAIADAWLPPIFSRVAQPMVVPTIDLTVHFRSQLPLADSASDDWVLCMFRTTVVQEGFLEEDGEIWSRDGRLIAQSRQLAVAMPFTP